MDTVCCELEDKAKKAANGTMATFCLDGWSNVANDPIIASSIQVHNKVYIVDIIDTNDEKHSAENLAIIADDHMQKAKEKYGVKIVAVVTDNAENMNSMRKKIQEKANVVQYGCSAHQLNLLAKDLLVPSQIVSRIVEVAKIFRNCQQPRAWLEEVNFLKPQLPSAVRWNSSVQVLEWFVNGWQKLRKIVEGHQDYFNGTGKGAAKLIRDITVFQQAEEALLCLKHVACALDDMQSIPKFGID